MVGASGSEGAEVLKRSAPHLASLGWTAEAAVTRISFVPKNHRASRIKKTGSTQCAPCLLFSSNCNYWLELLPCMLVVASPSSKAVFFPWKRMPASELGPLPFSWVTAASLLAGV